MCCLHGSRTSSAEHDESFFRKVFAKQYNLPVGLVRSGIGMASHDPDAFFAVVLRKEILEGNVHSMIFENARPVEFVSDAKTILEKVLSEGRRPCDIAILCASKNQFNSLPSFVSGTNGRTIKFTEDTSVWRNGSRILKTTVRAFKGLEAPIVVFCEGDLDEISEDRYVGESRAKYELYIVSERDTLS